VDAVRGDVSVGVAAPVVGPALPTPVTHDPEASVLTGIHPELSSSKASNAALTAFSFFVVAVLGPVEPGTVRPG
jgi:hypothetical protein